MDQRSLRSPPLSSPGTRRRKLRRHSGSSDRSPLSSPGWSRDRGLALHRAQSSSPRNFDKRNGEEILATRKVAYDRSFMLRMGIGMSQRDESNSPLVKHLNEMKILDKDKESNRKILTRSCQIALKKLHIEDSRGENLLRSPNHRVESTSSSSLSPAFLPSPAPSTFLPSAFSESPMKLSVTDIQSLLASGSVKITISNTGEVSLTTHT